MAEDKNTLSAENLDPRNLEELYSAFGAADHILLKKYVAQLDRSACIAPADSIRSISPGDNACLYEITSIVYDTEENVQDKLTTVYSSLLPFMQSSVVLMLKGEKDRIRLFLGAANHTTYTNAEDGILCAFDGNILDDAGNVIKGSFVGNFPGSVLTLIPSNDYIDSENPRNSRTGKQTLIQEMIRPAHFAAAVSSIPALRNTNEKKSSEFVQGMEKLIDTMRGQEYTMIILADAIGNDRIDSICADYEDIYGQLSPFKTSQQQFNSSMGDTNTESFISGVTDTTNESLSKSLSHGVTESVSKTDTVGISVGIKIISGNYSHAKSRTQGTTDTTTDTSVTGTAKSLSEQNSVSSALSRSTGESLTLSFENRSVQTLLDRIDEQIKRLRDCEDFGMFDACVYFLARDIDTVTMASGVFKSMSRGEKSSVESSAVNVWRNEEDVGYIKEYLSRFFHPMFCYVVDEQHDYPLTPAMLISGKELAYEMAMPKKSVPGLPVISCAAFGRNVMSRDKNFVGGIDLGCIYHMQRKEKNVSVALSADDLTMHTFITGSTGSGKSNTVYKILDQLHEKGASFLVIEPAKGEYKNVFGNRKNVSVYGTNPQLTELLRINPFSFPKEIHVYEHMDRLVEIFNVCWPMYAAMPAILKDAVERAYADAGWDLKTSTNRYDDRLFPTFVDVLRQIDAVMEESQYSADNKSDYKGALSTRLRSLTNGINGMIFCAEELSAETLFDSNVIVDLSRVGSTETKSLIMGLLVMKLQEHRMAHAVMNEHLRHVTVLEEAHNLLKRTSTEQSSEGANLVGKSVEMLTNAIAEMRTYGEGFIIADQAPGLLDMAVIRNTNTKIILRLPEYSDRELVGKAIGLNKDQIEELARLKKGVAAVYQNDWIEAVLCAVDKFETAEIIYKAPSQHRICSGIQEELLLSIATNTLSKKIELLDRRIISSDLPAKVKCILLEYSRDTNTEQLTMLAAVAYEFFSSEETLKNADKIQNGAQWMQYVRMAIKPSVDGLTEDEILFVINLIVLEEMRRHPEREKHICELFRGGYVDAEIGLR